MIRFTVEKVEETDKNVEVTIKDDHHNSYMLSYPRDMDVEYIREQLRFGIKGILDRKKKSKCESLVGEIYEFD